MDRIRALAQAPTPFTKAQLQSFLGFAQYYSKFVPAFSKLAQPLFEALAEERIDTEEVRLGYRRLLAALLDGKVLRSFQTGILSELIVDASEYAIGAVLEQGGHPVTCVSRKLSSSERNYSQTQKEALAINWAVQRLHKYLYSNPFVIVSDHKALQYIFDPGASVNKTTSSMLQRWALNLSGYQYTIKHRPGKEIAHADYLSRHASHENPQMTDDSTVLLSTPLPISRNQLIMETRLAYGPVLAGLRGGWSNSARKRFPDLYSKRSDLVLHADGVIVFKERVLIPPTCRLKVLQHLHLGHLGRDKMTSLARLLCWWPTLSMDIASFAKDCTACRVSKTSTHPCWTPWPITFRPMQRIHADYCGPFLDRFWILVVQDAFSKFPEVFITTSASADFTKKALKKLFAREGIAQVLVSDNGTHFTAQHLQTWLRSIGCHSVFSPPRHPQSNGQAENFVKTLKTAIHTVNPRTLDELDDAVNNFLLQFRNAVHPSTGKSPAMLFKGRNLRSSLNMDTTEVMFYRGNNNRPCDGLVVSRLGNRMFQVMDRADGSMHRRHRDQINLTPLRSLPTSNSSQNTELTPVQTSVTARNVITPRHRRRPWRSIGQCNDCTSTFTATLSLSCRTTRRSNTSSIPVPQ